MINHKPSEIIDMLPKEPETCPKCGREIGTSIDVRHHSEKCFCVLQGGYSCVEAERDRLLGLLKWICTASPKVNWNNGKPEFTDPEVVKKWTEIESILEIKR